MLLLHYDQGVEDGVAKEHAAQGQHRSDELTEAGDFPGSLDHSHGDHVADQNRAVQKDSVDAVSNEPPGKSAERGSGNAKDKTIRVIRGDGLVVARGLI